MKNVRCVVSKMLACAGMLVMALSVAAPRDGNISGDQQRCFASCQRIYDSCMAGASGTDSRAACELNLKNCRAGCKF